MVRQGAGLVQSAGPDLSRLHRSPGRDHVHVQARRTPKGIAHAKLDQPGKWVAVTIPTKDWQNIGVGLGTFSEFLLNVSTPGGGQASSASMKSASPARHSHAGQRKNRARSQGHFRQVPRSPDRPVRTTYFVSPAGDDHASGDADHRFAVSNMPPTSSCPATRYCCNPARFCCRVRERRDRHFPRRRSGAWVTFAAAPDTPSDHRRSHDLVRHRCPQHRLCRNPRPGSHHAPQPRRRQERRPQRHLRRLFPSSPLH